MLHEILRAVLELTLYSAVGFTIVLFFVEEE